jgi:hypothetical protein
MPSLRPMDRNAVKASDGRLLSAPKIIAAILYDQPGSISSCDDVA